MKPFLFQHGAISVASYPFFYGLGLVIGGIVFALLMQRSNIRFRQSVHFLLILSIMIVIGGRLLSVFVEGSRTTIVNKQFLAFISGGEILYGSLITGILVAWFLPKYLRLPRNSVLDAGAIAAPIGIAIGRIGCLLNGCCYGKVTSGWFAIRYPKMIDVEGNLLGNGPFVKHVDLGIINLSASSSAPVHPVPIYESLACLLMAMFLFILWKHHKMEGTLILAFVAIYSLWRFCVEFLRVHDPVFFNLTIYQCISIVLVTLSLGALAWTKKFS